ncbi:superoxide dismutase [Ectothiorhodospira mobilis]|uniref:superoxide dismutase n=1 Tax=Ectothiorhodospira mobilis TaxID=195064 RepID=UPI001EE7A4D9|nr:superoxide dismutase [Ectothiorhodospira mobilis]MCG5534992.1 superoxide dismutase [Ectothiorhodospira mobilis]
MSISLQRILILLLLGLAPLTSLQAQGEPGGETHPFTLPDLPYAYDALAPVIDAETMEIHHSRHHQGYVDKLNAALEEEPPEARELSLEALLEHASTLPAAVRNNAGGHWNHSFFWRSMTAPGEGGAPDRDLRRALEEAFGSLEDFRDAFETAGLDRFGSGWVWLIVEEDGDLAVTTTPNQDNPRMDVADPRGTPLLGNDLWEHAYYLNYRNARGAYLQAWWEVVDWERVSRRYAAATGR